MRKIIIIIAILFSVLVFGQDTSQNYTKVVTYRDSLSGSPQVKMTYYDGLGRPIQQIDNQQSNSGKDIVVHMEYDIYGRQLKEFLPFANQSPSLNYNANAANDVLTFYSANAYENTSNPYSEKLLEASPLNRVFKQAAPGTDWLLNPSGTDRAIKFEYQTNLDKKVKLYKVATAWSSTLNIYEPSLLNASGNVEYEFNQLYKTITKDENWTSGKNNTTEEFKDKEGKIILKRTYSNYKNETEVVHETYYIYDIYGNLTYVIPPLVDTDNAISQEVLDGLCYQYKYDYRNRLVEKKLPGKQWEFIVYDRLDRVVATGPALNPFGNSEVGWLFTKYDEFNRPIYTGWFKDFAPTTEGRNDMNNQYTLSELYETTFGTTIDGLSVGYSNKTFPDFNYNYKILTVNYYDRYDYPGAPTTIPSNVLGGIQSVFYNETIKPKGLPTGSWVRILSDENDLLGEISYTLYDSKSRPVRVNTTNEYYGGYTQTDSQIDFSGKVLLTETQHRRTDTDIELTTLDTYVYNAQDRLVLHKQQINGGQEQLIAKNTYDELGQLISKNVGGEDVTGAIGLQKVDYTYNIRGWLTSINNEQEIEEQGITLGSGDLFGFKINYNKLEGEIIPNVVKLYNGNIAETLWKSSSDNNLRKYSYQYDNLNRLLKGTYQKPSSVVPVSNSYNEELGYDKNGNIQYLLRNGDRDSDLESIGALPIDDLIYTYKEDSPNQLVKVLDRSAMLQGFKDDSDGITDLDDDFSYDDNGNLKFDANKEISLITYNHLNLPSKIQFVNGNFIEYIYMADGKKFQKKTVDYLGGSSATIEYFNGYQYKGGQLQFFPHPEGYVNVTNSDGGNYYNYVFNYTDHLGNIRLSYGIDPSLGVLKIIEENHYYPFGLKHTNYNSDQLIYQKGSEGGIALKRPGPTTPPVPSYKYKYSGKELQDELGLNMYDFGARNYDPALGRWMNIDPKAENSRRWTPYNYAYNNPLVFVDPDGMQADWFDKKAEKTAQATEKKIDKKIEELNKGNASDKNDRIAELNKSKADIADMRNDKNNEYKFDKASSNNNNPETKRTGANEVTIYTDDDSKQIHENRHGGQIARGEYDIDTSGNVTKGVIGASKEIDAYKAQYSFEGKIEYIPNIDFNNQTNIMNFTLKGGNSFKQTISSMGQINNAFLQKLVDNPGINQTPIYPDPATNPTYYQQ